MKRKKIRLVAWCTLIALIVAVAFNIDRIMLYETWSHVTTANMNQLPPRKKFTIVMLLDLGVGNEKGVHDLMYQALEHGNGNKWNIYFKGEPKRMRPLDTVIQTDDRGACTFFPPGDLTSPYLWVSEQERLLRP